MLLVILGLILSGCSGPKPILHPNDHFQEVGEAQAEQDIAECKEFAEEHVSSNEGKQVAGSTVLGAGTGAASGAVGGAIRGSAGIGAAIGAVAGAVTGFIRGLFLASTPNRTYQNFVDRCLEERGYALSGWE